MRPRGRSRPISCGTGRSPLAVATERSTKACGSTSATRNRSGRPSRCWRMSDAGAERPRGPAVFTIPAHRSFADSLVAGLRARFGDGPLDLAHGRILLPNNRAVRTVTEAFVRASDAGLVLPRLVPIGDPELEERIGGALDPADMSDPVPPAIDPLARLLALTQLVASDGTGTAEASRLAADLARTLDALLIEDVNPSDLAEAAAEAPDLARH